MTIGSRCGTFKIVSECATFLVTLPDKELYEIGLAVFDRKGRGGGKLHVMVALAGRLSPPREIPRLHVSRVGGELREFLERAVRPVRYPDLDDPVSAVGGGCIPDKTQAFGDVTEGIASPKALRRSDSRQCRCSQEPQPEQRPGNDLLG